MARIGQVGWHSPGARIGPDGRLKEAYISAWEFDASLNHGPDYFRLKFDRAQIEDRNRRRVRSTSAQPLGLETQLFAPVELGMCVRVPIGAWEWVPYASSRVGFGSRMAASCSVIHSSASSFV